MAERLEVYIKTKERELSKREKDISYPHHFGEGERDR